MIEWIWTTLGIAVGFWILSIIAACLGHCEIGLGEEYWGDERYEKTYYSFLAPVGCISLMVSLILVIIYDAIK